MCHAIVTPVRFHGTDSLEQAGPLNLLIPNFGSMNLNRVSSPLPNYIFHNQSKYLEIMMA